MLGSGYIATLNRLSIYNGKPDMSQLRCLCEGRTKTEEMLEKKSQTHSKCNGRINIRKNRRTKDIWRSLKPPNTFDSLFLSEKLRATACKALIMILKLDIAN